MKAKQWMWLFAALSVLMMAFIWSNSIRTVEQSSAQSDAVAKLLKPKLDPSQKTTDFEFQAAIRKAAHIAEYVALGLCVGGFTLCLGQLTDGRFVSMPLLIVLAVAVVDEYIQHFSGRGSAVTDVVLDFAGGVAGIAFAALGCQLIKKRKNKRKED